MASPTRNKRPSLKPKVGISSFYQLLQWLKTCISLLGCLEVGRDLYNWVYQAHSIKLGTVTHLLLLWGLHHAWRLFHMLHQAQPFDVQEDSPGPHQLSQLGVIPTQWTLEALVSDCCSAVHILSLGNLSTALWVQVSLIWQGNLAGSALLLCYWASSWQSFVALIHQNIYRLMSYTRPLH